jgi:hypothetical protein
MGDTLYYISAYMAGCVFRFIVIYACAETYQRDTEER